MEMFIDYLQGVLLTLETLRHNDCVQYRKAKKDLDCVFLAHISYSFININVPSLLTDLHFHDDEGILKTKANDRGTLKTKLKDVTT